MDSKTYKKIHEAQIQRLKDECEKRVDSGIIVAERYNPEWIEDCDAFIAKRCRDMAQKGFVQVLDEAVHQMATDYFNDELHGKWKGMKFEGLGECKNEEEEDEREDSGSMTKILEKEIADRNSELHALREESLNKSKKIAGLEKNLKEVQKDLKSAQKDAEKARKDAEKARMAVEKVKKEPKIEKKPVIAPNHDQYDLFALAGV